MPGTMDQPATERLLTQRSLKGSPYKAPGTPGSPHSRPTTPGGMVPNMVKVVVRGKANMECSFSKVVVPCLLMLCIGMAGTFLLADGWKNGLPSIPLFAGRNESVVPPTLVIYIFYPKIDDPEYTNNFKYFIREGIKANDGCDYIIVVQLDEGTHSPLMDDLPSNAKYVMHPNSCFDIGTVGWALREHVNLDKYKYFFWINSGVRGPYLPAWARKKGLHWAYPFIDKLNNKVKMVGPTINCGGAFESPAVPHVQTYMVGLDRVGLDVLLQANIFNCWLTWKEAIVNGELGAARAIFNAGYTIDSMMLRYQNVDWRSPALAGCNAHMQPIQQALYDGIDINPLEVMFVKVKTSMLKSDWTHVVQAVKYDDWFHQELIDPDKRAEYLITNDFQANAPKILEGYKKRGKKCFDAEFYVQSNLNDLQVLRQAGNLLQATWEHFLKHGFLEGRTYRFDC